MQLVYLELQAGNTIHMNSAVDRIYLIVPHTVTR